MNGRHAAPKDGRKAAGQFSPQAPPPADDAGWAADLNAAEPWAGPAPEPPAPAEPVTDPDMDAVPAEPSPEWLDAVAIDGELNAILALADKALSVAAAERVLRDQQDAASRGRAALLAWAADGSATALAATRPYAMTAVLPVPDQGDLK